MAPCPLAARSLDPAISPLFLYNATPRPGPLRRATSHFPFPTPPRSEAGPPMNSVIVEFFSTLTDTTRRRGPYERVHFEGRSLVAINGERRMTLAVINEDGVWVDDSGAAWIDLDVQPSPP